MNSEHVTQILIFMTHAIIDYYFQDLNGQVRIYWKCINEHFSVNNIAKFFLQTLRIFSSSNVKKKESTILC